MSGKKGEVTIGFVIAIVLGVLILVFAAFTITTGTVPFFGAITNFGGGQVNVQQIVQSCQLACSTQSTFDYCSKIRDVVFEKGEEKAKVTCMYMEGNVQGVINAPQISFGGVGRCDTINPVNCAGQTTDAMNKPNVASTNAAFNLALGKVAPSPEESQKDKEVAKA